MSFDLQQSLKRIERAREQIKFTPRALGSGQLSDAEKDAAAYSAAGALRTIQRELEAAYAAGEGAVIEAELVARGAI